MKYEPGTINECTDDKQFLNSNINSKFTIQMSIFQINSYTIGWFLHCQVYLFAVSFHILVPYI